MKRTKLVSLILLLTLLLSSCASAQEDSPLPSITPAPSSTPFPFMKEAAAASPTPEPEPEPSLREKIALAFNHMVRCNLDQDFDDDSLLKGIPKQKVLVKVYAPEKSIYYCAFMEFDDRILRIQIQNDLPGYFAYRGIWLHEGEMPGDTYEYNWWGYKPPQQAELLDEFTYTFDPDCEFTYENKYFYIWEEMRDQVIEELKSDSMTSGEYTFLFCDYDEMYFPGPEEAGLVVVEIRDGGESYYCYTINRECITYRKPLFDMSEKEMEYYKSREFDRETVYVE